LIDAINMGQIDAINTAQKSWISVWFWNGFVDVYFKNNSFSWNL